MLIGSARDRLAISVLVSVALAALAGCSAPRDRAAADDHGIEAPPAAGAGAAAHAGAGAAGPGMTPDARDRDGGSSGSAGQGAEDCPSPPELPTPDEPRDPDTAQQPAAVQAHRYFAIRVVDGATGTALAGARLETTHHVVLFSDRNGMVAFYEPGLMDTGVYFEAIYPGYELAADALGFRGRALQIVEGGAGEIAMTRVADAAAPAVASDLQTRLLDAGVPAPSGCQAIHVVDAATGRGVPLVRVSAGDEEYWSDSQGLVAYCNPDRIGERVEFEVFSHGYRLAPGSSAALDLGPGGNARLELERINIAERLYRVTGQGIYRDSLLLGRATPLPLSPAHNGLVMGQDSVQSAVYGGRVFWIWGDTVAPDNPLGNYHASGARSELPALGGLAPQAGVDARYFVDATTGFVRAMAPPSSVPGDGVTWLNALTVVPDAAGRERLLAGYGKFRDVFTQTERGIVEFDDDRELFVEALQFEGVDGLAPDHHPLYWHHQAGDYVYYPPSLRVPARAEALVDPASYESFTAHAAGTRELERAPDGTLVYGWKAATAPVSEAELDAAAVDRDQALDGHLHEPDTGERVAVHGSSARTWNAHRGRFVQITLQVAGSTSAFGEIWYAEADTPLGPWVYARKIVSHDNYTFYNPRQHPFFDQAGGRVIFFEGSYTTTFSEDAQPTPRYDYNQIMYRLDLDDARLVLPVPVYDLAVADAPGDFATKTDLPPGAGPLRAAFFAADRARADLVPLAWSSAACSARRLLPAASTTTPVFYALPGGAEPAPAGTLALYEYVAPGGRFAYRAGEGAAPAGFTRAAEPIAHVWPSPIRVALPVGEYGADVVARAGPDQCVAAPAPDATAAVSLDAGESTSLRGAITSYVWYLPDAAPCPVALGERASVALPAGVHTVRLEVTDASGQADSDSLVIEVSPPP